MSPSGCSFLIPYSNLINVARKAQEIPALKKAVEDGAFSVARARKIVPVLTEQNQSTWIEAATTLCKTELERRVANESPFTKIPERIKAVAMDRVMVTFGLSRAAAGKLQRARDILASQKGCNATLEAMFESMLDEFIKKHDPIEKAARAVKKAQSPRSAAIPAGTPAAMPVATPVPMPVVKPAKKQGVRTAIPHEILHRVNARDGGRCTYQHQGRRCTQTRFLHFHHQVPVAFGGAHSLENITTLCGSHHRLIHAHLSMDRWHAQNQRPRYALQPTRPRS